MAISPGDMPRHYYSLDEYFALEHAGDARFEYWNGDIFCMSGSSPEHGIICSNVLFGLGEGGRGRPCRAFTCVTAILTPTLPPYRYPDASVACGELQFKNVRGVGALINPVVIIEVLSPNTAIRDHGAKFTVYQAIETFREYLLISQDDPRVIHYTREADGAWRRRDVTRLDDTLHLESISCALSMRDIYDGVTFAA
jgi:Uma2 family endonuclease